MKRFTRIAALCCCLILAISLAACKPNKNPHGSSDSGSATSGGSSANADDIYNQLITSDSEEVVNTETGYAYVAPKYNLADGPKVKFLSWWVDEETEFLKAYMRKYGGAEIDFITYTYGDTGSKLQAMVLANNAPDVFKMRGGSDLFGLMRQGVFSDITNLFDWKSNNWKGYTNYLKYYTYNGQILAAPENNANYFIWYNKTIFQEYGVEDPVALYESDQWTLDKFSDVCRKLTIKEGGNTTIYGFGFDHCWFLQCLAMFNTNFANISDTGTITSNFADPKMDEAMEFIRKQASVERVYCDQSKANAYFASGKLAMLYYGNWLPSSEPYKSMNAAGKIDLVPCPANSKISNECRHWFNLDGHAIPVGAKNVDQARAFIEIFNYYKQTIEFDERTRAIELESNGMTEAQYMRYRGVRKFDNPVFFDLSYTWDQIFTEILNGKNWLSIRDTLEPGLLLVIDGIPK